MQMQVRAEDQQIDDGKVLFENHLFNLELDLKKILVKKHNNLRVCILALFVFSSLNVYL